MFRKKDETAADAPAGTVNRRAGVARPGKSEAAAPTAKTATSPGPRSGASPAGAVSGKQAYEMRRAEKAGMGLEKWMAEKDRRVQAEREAVQRARKLAEPRKPGLLRRLLDRAHRPI